MTQVGYVYDSTVYYRARYYDPSIGRFLSEDPIGSGDSSLYVYSGNDPIDFVDPFGLRRRKPPVPPPSGPISPSSPVAISKAFNAYQKCVDDKDKDQACKVVANPPSPNPNTWEAAQFVADAVKEHLMSSKDCMCKHPLAVLDPRYNQYDPNHPVADPDWCSDSNPVNWKPPTWHKPIWWPGKSQD